MGEERIGRAEGGQVLQDGLSGVQVALLGGVEELCGQVGWPVEGLGARAERGVRGNDVGNLLGVDAVHVYLFPLRACDRGVWAAQPDPQAAAGRLGGCQGRHRHGSICLVHGFPQGQCRLAEPVLVDRWRRTQAQVARGVELLGPGDVARGQG